jgi:hypothetical protein
MVVSMVKPKWMIHTAQQIPYTAICWDSKLWPESLGASQCLYPERQSQKNCEIDKLIIHR